jgi:Uma2 family endonuclease
MKTRTRATIEDLYKVPGKAELVNGEIVYMSPTGGYPGIAGDEIFASLRDYVRRTRQGLAVSDNKAFVVTKPRIRTFSPDAAYYLGEPTPKFFQGIPIFAAEVRSEGDYGPAAEKEMADKRHDYFEAGTLVVWDVDVLRGDDVVRVYRSEDPDRPTIYRRGDIAEAEPAVPGWTMPVDHLFSQLHDDETQPEDTE